MTQSRQDRAEPAARGTEPLQHLLNRLLLERLEPYLFRDAGAPSSLPRLFGGQVAAQALAAAGRTVDPHRHVHSLHVHFVGRGQSQLPLLFRVQQVKSGNAFDLRRIEVQQRGRLILQATASFHHKETSPDHVPTTVWPCSPDTLPRWHEQLDAHREQLTALWNGPRPMDVRYADIPPLLDPNLREGHRDELRTFVRADGGLPDAPLIHACALTYATDMTLLETAILPHGVVWADRCFDGASLDHTVWFHRPFRADTWLLYEQQAVTTGGARGFARGSVFDHTGALVASVAQEGLLRATNGREQTLNIDA